MELAIIDGKKAMDSRDIAALTKKRHADICRDIRGLILTVSNGCNFASVYLDKKNEERICYKLPYRETMILLSGYSVELRAAVIDRWIYLENKYNKIRDKSKEVRNHFTDMLKEHGYKEPYEYIQTTKQMKDRLSIKNKKNDMTIKELKKIRVAEELADLLIDDEAGFHEVNPICLEGCETVNRFLFDKTIRNLEKKIVGAFNEP